MTKAEEKSEQYKNYREQCGIKDPIMLDEIEEAYFEGYLQAEKDLMENKHEKSWILDEGANDYCVNIRKSYVRVKDKTNIFQGWGRIEKAKKK